MLPQNDLPGDDLDAISAFVWAELTRASRDNDSQFRHAQLATTGAQGWPQARTVILRHADADRREVGFHTHRRSHKVGELEAAPAVTLVAYDRPRGLQLRLWGQAEVHVGNAQAEQAWTALYPPLRTPYRTRHAPGRPIGNPREADHGEAERDNPDHNLGFEDFAFVEIRLARLEWLQLRPTGHRRARFDWAGRWQGQWLAP